MNKRIKKKRAKVKMARNKGKLIAEFLVGMYPNATRYEYLTMAKPLLKMEMPMLIDVLCGVLATRRLATLRSVLRPMPRDVPVVNWSYTVKWRSTISDVHERTKAGDQ